MALASRAAYIQLNMLHLQICFATQTYHPFDTGKIPGRSKMLPVQTLRISSLFSIHFSQTGSFGGYLVGYRQRAPHVTATSFAPTGCALSGTT
jgi:hypothetical protein